MHDTKSPSARLHAELSTNLANKNECKNGDLVSSFAPLRIINL